MQEANRRLMFHGMCLFLLGLLTGFAEQHFANIRMGLAAHLEGVMNGTFLVALGAIWPRIRADASRALPSLALMGTTKMSSLQMFLPVSEPARSEALSRLKRTAMSSRRPGEHP